MTFSSLIDGVVPHHNKYSSRGGTRIARVLQHHHAASSDAGLKRLINPTEPASATYIIMSSGSILGQVPEEFRPWTSSSAVADNPSITFEVQNISGQFAKNDSDPRSWAISDEAYNSIINLLADIAFRHTWGGVGPNHYRGHREFAPTACPGGYLWARMDATRKAADAIYRGYGAKGVILNPQSTTSKEDDMFNPQNSQQLTKVVDDADRSRDILDSVEEPLHEKLLRINRYIKGDQDATIYEIMSGNLRPMTALEWELLGKTRVDKIFPQAKIDKMPKLPVVS